MLLMMPTTPTIRIGAAAALNLLTDGAAALEVLVHEISIDDGNLRAVGSVSVVEYTTFDKRDLHRTEVIRSDDLLACVRTRFAGPGRVSHDRVGPRTDVAVERYV